MSVVLFVVLAGITALVSAVVAVSGVQSADARAPSRRALGWLLLVVIAAVLGGLRATTTGESSLVFALFGVVVTLLAGWASGRAHRELSPYWSRVAEYRHATELKADKLAEADRERNKLAAVAQQVDHRISSIRQEAEALRSSPEHARRARAEFRRLVDARIAAARALYRQGARFAGRETDDA